MDFILTEEQKQIKALIKDFFRREVDLKRMWELSQKAATVKTIEELRAIQPWDLMEKLHELGLHQLCVPTKYGGGGVTLGGNVTRAIASEEAGYRGGPAARLITKNWQLCASMAMGHTTEEQKDWFFSQFMSSPTFSLAGAVSEPSGATDIHLPYDEPGVAGKVFAYKDGNEWVINGDKMFSSAAGTADLIRVDVRTDKQAPISQATTCFWVAKDTPGLTMEINRMIISDIYGNVQTHYDNVRVPESHMMGEVNQGFSVRGDITAKKTVVFAGLLGDAQRLYEHMRDYAKERIQGGKPIIQHANIAGMLGEAALNLEATRAFMYRGAWENDQRELAGEPPNLFWSIGTFYHVKKMSLRLAEIASEIYGGIGGSVDMPLANFVRRLYLFLPGGSTTNMNAIKCSMEYNAHIIG